jgi:hypothetical protein
MMPTERLGGRRMEELGLLGKQVDMPARGEVGDGRAGVWAAEHCEVFGTRLSIVSEPRTSTTV